MMMAQPVLATAHIVIVDDHLANVRFLEELLQDAGYLQLTSTTDPRQLLPLIAAHPPDLVLLDLHMPHLDGFALLGELANMTPVGSYLPILVLTADVTPAVKRRALAEGATDFLSKPLDAVEVLLRIRNLLETRRLHLQLQRHNEELEAKVRAYP